MLIYRPVRGGEVPLIAAGGHHEGVRQMERAGKGVGVPGILNGHIPRPSVGSDTVDVHVAAQTGEAAGCLAGGEQRGHRVGGVALGDAAQINGASGIQ